MGEEQEEIKDASQESQDASAEVQAEQESESVTTDEQTREVQAEEEVLEDVKALMDEEEIEVIQEEAEMIAKKESDKIVEEFQEEAPVVQASDIESESQVVEDTSHQEEIVESDSDHTATQEIITEEILEVTEDSNDEPADREGKDKEVSTTEISEETQTEKYDHGLEKTRKTFGERLNELFAKFRHVDEDFFEELEDTLITSDVGFNTAMQLTDELREEVKLKNAKKPTALQNTIIEKLVDIYEKDGEGEDTQIHYQKDGLSVILFVGVNGAGKTTTVGKLAHQLKDEGKKVILAAADTFRAGAIDQLAVWGERAGVDVVRGKEGGDPASVVFDAVKKAQEEDADVLLVDTAGRLQNKVNLMNELAKIKRVIQREIPDAPHEVLLVLDATTGQNAMSQAKQFKETTDVTGLVLTKLDGTAKGGIVLAIRNELHLPVKLVGLGEKIDDLAIFDAEKFAYGLFKGLWKGEN